MAGCWLPEVASQCLRLLYTSIYREKPLLYTTTRIMRARWQWRRLNGQHRADYLLHYIAAAAAAIVVVDGKCILMYNITYLICIRKRRTIYKTKCVSAHKLWTRCRKVPHTKERDSGVSRKYMILFIFTT